MKIDPHSVFEDHTDSSMETSLQEEGLFHTHSISRQEREMFHGTRIQNMPAHCIVWCLEPR
jgi:hypothetical protein